MFKFLAYDACHNLIKRRIKTGEGQFTEQAYAYDSKGRLVRETDGEGHETGYHYEEHSAYPSLTTYSDGTELKCEYNKNGRKLSEDDGAVRWEYAYNQGGWRTMERDGEGWTYTYDAENRLTSVTGPDGAVENTYAYDLWGNCVRKTDGKGSSTYYA